MTIQPPKVSRRFLLKGSGAVALVIGVSLTESCGRGDGAPLAPNAFVRVAPDNTVTVIIKHSEMGQGITTGLATLVADELDADWDQVKFEYAPANDDLYKNNFIGFQVTAGSTSIANSFDQMRAAGAMARAMLVAAAAKAWDLPEEKIIVEKGVLKSGWRRASFGSLASAAAAMKPPAAASLKTPDRFTLIGKPIPRLDTRAKSTGKQIYTIDVKLPGLLTAVVARPPAFGATVKAFDASRAMQVKGVRKVVEIPEGVAVIADGMWPAIKGRRALSVSWDKTGAELRSTPKMVADFKRLLERPGGVARRAGNVARGFARAPVRVKATYEFPYLAHAPMEPLNCVVQLTPQKLETWSGHQAPTWDQYGASVAAGLAPQQVVVNSLPSGGSFGRRGGPDYVVEAVHIAKASGLEAPIRLQRTREDDMSAGYYRPLFVHSIKAALDSHGAIAAWRHRIVGQSILGTDPMTAKDVKDGVDRTSVEGAADMPYAAPNILVDMHITNSKVPVRWWRSVGHSHTAYAVETMIDELAHAARIDPVDFRLAHLRDKPRLARVLTLVAEKSGWSTPAAAGVGRGIALHEFNGSVVAQVAEVAIDKDGGVKPIRVVAAVDCGLVINPDVVRSQIEGGIGFGLSAALYSEVTLERGAVVETNFHTYPVLRIDHMPKLEVHIVDSSERPSGVGEIAVPPIGPAVANALAALTGQRIRELPIARNKLKSAG